MVDKGYVPSHHVYGNDEIIWQKQTQRELKVAVRPINMSWDKPIPLSDHLYYVPRGCVLNIDGINIGCLGGGYSIDNEYREDGIDWFSLEETIHHHNVEYAIDNFSQYDSIDIFVSHDTVDKSHVSKHNYNHELTHQIYSDINMSQSMMLQEVKGTINPFACVHGHHHTAYVDFVDYDNSVESDFYNIGLGKNAGYGCFSILPKLNTYALNNEDQKYIHLLGYKDTIE